MKVFIGSFIIIILLAIGIWFLLSPTYKKVGNVAKKYNDFWEGEEKDGQQRNKDDKTE
jgi:hypothetical protein